MITGLKVAVLVLLLVGCVFMRSISEECSAAIEACEAIECCDVESY